MSKEIVKTTIDGVEVECEILHRSAGDFGIEIIKPFQNITCGLHIPYFSRSRCSFIGESGDMRIVETLHNIYGFGQYIKENMTHLREKVRELDIIIETLSATKITEKEFKEVRIKLRRLLRNGEISNRYYQKVLRWWQVEMNSLWLEIDLYHIDPFFEENFPEIVPIGTREEILDILRSKAVLIS